MRIAFYAPMKPPAAGVPSGDRAMARTILAALEKAGHSVFVASELRAYDGHGDRERQKRIATNGADEAGHLLALWRRDRTEGPDAWVTYHNYYKSPDWIGPHVAQGLAIPYAIVEPSHAAKRRADPRWSLNHAQAELAIRSADALFPMTARDLEGIAPLAAPHTRVSMLAPFIDAAPFRKAAADRGARRLDRRARLGVNKDITLLLSVAMMRPGAKTESYRALSIALRSLLDVDWVLAVAGDGPAHDEVRACFGPLGEERIRWLGQIPHNDMPALYAAADLFVWPGCAEAYGVAYLEAAAAGLATASFRSAGVPAVVVDGITGLLAPEGDCDALAGIIRTLTSSARLRHGLGAAGAQMMQRERNLETAGELITRAISGRRARQAQA